MPFTQDIPLMLSVATLLGVAALLLARAARVPGIVVLLITGVGFGPEGLGIIQPDVLGKYLLTIVSAAVAIILFEGGLQLRITELRRNQTVIFRLITSGALITAVGGTLVTRLILGWDWHLCILFGTLVIVTGPTVVAPLLKRIRLRRDLQTILQAEGVLIDPIGAMIAVVALEVITATAETGWVLGGMQQLVVTLGFGALVGIAAGAALAWILRRPYIVPDEYANIVVLGIVLALFHGSNAVFHESGIMAVTIAGVVAGNSKLPVRRAIIEFKEQLTAILIGLLFILLAANVRLRDVLDLGWPGIAVVLALMLIVRPLGIMWSARGTRLSKRAILFMSWLAPRGIVAAAVTSIFAVRLEELGMPGGKQLQALVFLVIAATVLCQGLTADVLARSLGLRMPRDDGYVLVGGGPFTREVGRCLSENLDDIVIIDGDTESFREAEGDGFRIIFGNAMETTTLRRAKVSTRRAVIAMTPNAALNLEVLRKARQVARDVPLFLVQKSKDISESTLRTINALEGCGSPVDVEYWNALLRRQLVRTWRLNVPKLKAAADDEGVPWRQRPFDLVPVVLTEKGVAKPFRDDDKAWKEGQTVTFLVHASLEDDVLGALAARGWSSPERGAREPSLPKVENFT